MIAQALGQKICSIPSGQKTSSPSTGLTNGESNEYRLDPNLDYVNEATAFPNSKLGPSGGKKNKAASKSSNYNYITSIEMKGHDKAVSSSSSNSNSLTNTNSGRVTGIQNLEKEQIGAAKRIFAHALGLPSSKGNNGLNGEIERKQTFQKRDLVHNNH